MKTTSPTGMFITENAIRFVRWADGFTRPITPQDVIDRFDVSRATAYRWLKAYDSVGHGKQVAVAFDHVAAPVQQVSQ